MVAPVLTFDYLALSQATATSGLVGTYYPILEVEVYEFVSHYSRWFDPVNSFVSFATTAPPLEHYLMWIDSNPTGPLLHLW